MLKVDGLSKKFERFEIKDVSFNLEAGYILGFIGANGAGKSTTIKSILNIIKPDSGNVTIFGKDLSQNEYQIKQDIGILLGSFNYYSTLRVKRVIDVYKRFYKNWDEKQYRLLLNRFCIDENKKIRELSEGMKVKLGLATALSHHAKLLILDEPTSGLDPLARDELLQIFREIISDGQKSILFSTHITSDLDKCADFIVFIHDGRLLSFDTKDNLIQKHALVKGGKNSLSPQLKSNLIGVKTNSFGFSGLILQKNLPNNHDLTLEKPNLEDIMVYYNKKSEENQ